MTETKVGTVLTEREFKRLVKLYKFPTRRQEAMDALLADRRILREQRDDLLEALKPVMGTLNYYIGPAARSLVSREDCDRYKALEAAIAKAEGDSP